MTRVIALTIIAAFVVALCPFAPQAAAEKNPEYGKLLKKYKDGFKTKNSLKERRKAVSILSKSKDPRGVFDLAKDLKKQEKHAGKKRKEWQKEEDAWKEKTERLEKGVEKRRQRAKERGEDSITVNQEESEWLGSNSNKGKMYAEKARIEKLYKKVLAEEDFGAYILRGMAKILNGLEGEEYAKAGKKLASLALAANKRMKPAYVQVLGYTKGDVVTTALEKIAKDTNPVIVMGALESLGRQNTPRGREILFQYLDDERWQIRSAAVQGLSFRQNADVVERLIKQAGKEEGSVKRRCFQALSVIVGEKVKATMEAWMSWWQANKADVIERWKRLPSDGLPIQEDLPVIAMDSEENSGSTSFYGIKTDSKHIIFVVDVSGSMGPHPEGPEDQKVKIDTARTELLNALKSLSAADEDERGAASFNIVAFSTGVVVYKEGKMVTATLKNKKRAFKWIEEHVQPTSMTNIFDALDQAFNIISGSSDKKNMNKGADTIFLMTDGSPNRGKFHDPDVIVEEITRINQERKITIHTIGVGKGHHRPFLQALAAKNNGKYISRVD